MYMKMEKKSLLITIKTKEHLLQTEMVINHCILTMKMVS